MSNDVPGSGALAGGVGARGVPMFGRSDLGFLMDVELRVSVELGRCRMRIDELLQLGPGGIVKLDKLAGEPLDVRVNDRLIAHGEAVVLGEKFGVRLVDVVERPERN
jgi:flagellar motor switch protein FliN/FliY